MPTPPLPKEEALRRFAILQKYVDAGYAIRGQIAKAGEVGALSMAMDEEGRRRDSGKGWLASAESVLGPFPWPSPLVRRKKIEIEDPPDLPQESRDIETLLEDRRAEYRRKNEAAQARNLIPIKVKINGPIAIAHFGDPHVDDPGCDILQLERDMQTVNETEGMFGANVGDFSNNWVGRLSHLYSDQTTTHDEAWKLVEWMVGYLQWLYLIAGNHDVWSGARDPVKWMVRNKSSLYEPHGVRIGLNFPNGKQVRINCRHDFTGHSGWNPAHGPMKAAQMGWRDHVLACGHKHTSAYGVVKDPSDGLISHCIRVAGYKIHDDYGKRLGLPNQNIAPTFVTIIQPEYDDDDPRLITTFFSVQEAAEYLTHLRSK